MRKTIKPILTIVPLLLPLILPGCTAQEKIIHIGVLQWTEKIDSFQHTYRGVIDGLESKGYKEGMNLRIEYRNVEQDDDLALQIAEGFVEKEVDLIVSLGTGSSLAALEATEGRQIPIVYSIVANPRATGIIREYTDSGKNITGVTMKVPIGEQFRVVEEVLPPFERLGILYCKEMPQAAAAGEGAAAAAAEFGWTPLTVSFPRAELPRLCHIVEELARQVDVIYLPADPITSSPAHREIIVRVTDGHGKPLIAADEGFVEEGALMAVHCDFYEIGRQAADLAAQVLAGVAVRMIPSQKPTVKRLSLNLRKAQELRIEIGRNVILKADTLFD